MPKLRAFFELIRLPNLFTAAADILAGYFFVTGELHLSATLLWLIVASCSLYAAGIVINDLRDIETDRRERPNRPLPSGRISRSTAIKMAIALAACGVAAATLAWSPTEPLAALTRTNRTGLLSGALLIAILLYNLVLKETPIGPLAMGLCRSLNLAMAVAISQFDDPTTFRIVIAIVVSFGMYVAAFTYFGRDEAGTISRRRLVIGFVGMLASLLALGVLAASAGDPAGASVVLWLALLVHVFRVGLRTVRNPSPAMVQYAMKTFILAIIAIDAVIGGTTAGLAAALVILALLIPALSLGRWVYST